MSFHLLVPSSLRAMLSLPIGKSGKLSGLKIGCAGCFLFESFVMGGFLRRLNCDLEVTAAQIFESADEGFNQAEVPGLQRVLSSRSS
jgi:hypothetical protein